MNDNDIRRDDASDPSGSVAPAPRPDPLASTAPGRDDLTPDPTAPTSTDEAANRVTDPSADPSADPTSTLALPVASPTPFRVEPATPVPDDVVAERTAALPHLPPPSTAAVPHPMPTSATVASDPQREPLVRRGPRPGAVMLGLLTMIVAGYVLAENLTQADLSFRLVGPPVIGAFGGMLLLIGLVGVLVGRLRR